MEYMGKCLTFVMKYWQEVSAIYASTEDYVEAHDSYPQIDQETYRKIEDIFKRAEKEAKSFLADVTSDVQKYIKSLGPFYRIRNKNPKNKWRAEMPLWHGENPGQNYHHSIGLYFRVEKPTIGCWLWSTDRKEVQMENYALLKKTELSSHVRLPEELSYNDLGRSPLMLKEVKLLPDNFDGDDLNRKELVDKCVEPFTMLNKDILRKILNDGN